MWVSVSYTVIASYATHYAWVNRKHLLGQRGNLCPLPRSAAIHRGYEWNNNSIQVCVSICCSSFDRRLQHQVNWARSKHPKTVSVSIEAVSWLEELPSDLIVVYSQIIIIISGNEEESDILFGGVSPAEKRTAKNRVQQLPQRQNMTVFLKQAGCRDV